MTDSEEPVTQISRPPDGWPVLENTTLVSPTETVVQSSTPLPVERPSDRGIGAGMLLAIVVFALVTAGVLAALLLSRRGHSSTTTVVVTRGDATSGTAATPLASASASRRSVPDLGGLPLAQARARLAALGLRDATTPVSSGRPAGTILEQAPKPGAKLAKGSSVTLLVSAATTSTTTPASGTTTASATATTTPATTIAPTRTAPTTAAPPPPQNASMPDVTNQNEASAAQRLAQASILASVFFVPSSDPLGTVEQQAKAAGAAVPYHAHVQINVSRRPSDNPLEHVPNVIGKNLQDAISALQATKLRLIYVKLPITSRARAGTIVQQSPLVGANAPQNAQILVFLGAYRSTH